MMILGKLDFAKFEGHGDLVVAPVRKAIELDSQGAYFVTEIDPTVADTAAFCEKYGIGLDISANCVILEAKRGERLWHVACMVLATDRIDVNGIVRRFLDARKISFASMDQAVSLTHMEYGGITPVGLPADWTILVDEHVSKLPHAVIGSGLRKSKLAVSGNLLAHLPNASVIALTKSA